MPPAFSAEALVHRAGDSAVSERHRLKRFSPSEPRLRIYRFYLEDIARRAAHTLSDAEEKILAEAGPLSGSPSNIFNILSNADFPYPTITLSDGRTVKVDQAGYTRFARSPIAPIARRPCRRSSRRSAASAARSGRR